MYLIFSVAVTCIKYQDTLLEQTVDSGAVRAVDRPVMNNTRCRDDHSLISLDAFHIGEAVS
ncbi:hypothetical protein D3C73_1485480 [compost metagenome]